MVLVGVFVVVRCCGLRRLSPGGNRGVRRVFVAYCGVRMSWSLGDARWRYTIAFEANDPLCKCLRKFGSLRRASEISIKAGSNIPSVAKYSASDCKKSRLLDIRSNIP